MKRIKQAFVALAIIASPQITSAVDPDAILLETQSQVSLIKNASIAAPIDGVISSVSVTEGDQIDAGTLLVRLEASRAKTELAAAKAAYQAAKIQSSNDVDERYARRTLSVSEREYRQSVAANERFAEAVSEIELDRLRLVVQQAELAIEQAAHEREVAVASADEKAAGVEIALARLEKHSIQSTINGMVAEVSVQPGEWVEPGKPIVRIISLDPVRVECFIDGRKFGNEIVGNDVVFQVGVSLADGESSEPQGEFSGKVTFVSPELQAVTGQVRLWATIPNPKMKLRAGMTGKLMVLK